VLHRATYLGVSFAGGRTVQLSLPPTLVATARRGVANYQAWWRAIETISAINRELLRRRRDAPGQSAGAAARGRPRRRRRSAS
jgi:predicted cobalt transporter CbtA